MSAFSTLREFAGPADHAACQSAIRTGSRTFYAASKLLPFSVRKPAYGLYAFCRLSDDAIDLGDGSPGALERLRHRLTLACEGRPLPFPADRAMADLMRRHAIPRAVPEALLEGLGWDCDGRRYETLEDLQGYAARVASTVGVMMTLLMGVRDAGALARACDLGVAMQLTNIARDVGEDARAGRLYLPLAWLSDARVDADAFLADPRPSDALRGVIARLLATADKLYARARSGVAALPASCRPAILAAADIYGAIGTEVTRARFDSVTRHARVSGGQKLRLLAKAAISAAWIPADQGHPPLAATAFLIDEVVHSRLRPEAKPGLLGALLPRFGRIVEIVERLERAEQFGE